MRRISEVPAAIFQQLASGTGAVRLRGGSPDPLLDGLFLKPAQAVAKPLMLGDHRAYLLERVDQRVLGAQHDRGYDTHVFLQCILPSEHALHLGAQEFEGDILGHG
jgi:hypothetical protein